MADQPDIPFWDFEARKNKTPNEVAEHYNRKASIYDKTVKTANFCAHVALAEDVAEFFGPERIGSVKILDVAAGTGLAAEELFKKGFRNIDWLDPSVGMKNEAQKKGVYSNYYLEFLDGHRIESIATDTYDCVTMNGGLNIGLVPCIALLEMVRVTKPGGLVCFSAVASRNHSIDEYNNRLEPLMSWMEEDGIWTLVDKKISAYYASDPNNGLLYRYIVRASDVSTETYDSKLSEQK